VLTGVLYAPVRFFLDFLRPEGTDPRYAGLTFAQWSSILAFGVAVYAATRVMKTGKPAEPVTRTAREAQERLRIVLRDDDEVQKKREADKREEAERKQAEIARLRAERDREDAELEAEALAAGKAAGAEAAAAGDAAGKAESSPAASSKPAGGKPGGGGKSRKR
jgi:hypothetical protein